MHNWRIIGILATLVIVISLPLYSLKELQRTEGQEKEEHPSFVTSRACEKCHKKEYQEWQDSHHAKAMAMADETTVVGDFNNTVFEKGGVRSRFYKKEGSFFVHTRGPGGEMAEYAISHTFGVYPLQQYLIPFPGGRLQCLPIAWDSRDKKWFHLYPDLDLDPGEWIYWTNQGQNWNSMCADCHSTELRKNYDPATDSYDTRWAEISVGCEACHGPGSKHVAWGELPAMARGQDDGLLVTTSSITNRQQVELCAPCHSRRSMLGDYKHLQQDLLETGVVRLLEEGLYFPDGQIRDEVYVYGSFVQSKMYANDVRCSDCHNPHTIKLHEEGNKLCLQCHQASVYDSKSHHFHKKKGEEGEPVRDKEGNILFAVGTGVECVGCHMPGRYYMVNDYRPDHSIRIPRPDLSVRLGTPNGCNRCHVDKTNEWSAEHTRKWYGSKEKYHFGDAFSEGREGQQQAWQELVRINQDPLASLIVRATSLSLLAAYPEDEVLTLFQRNLTSEESLLRRTALVFLPQLSPEKYQALVGPLLDDPVKGVRIEAGRALNHIPQEQLDKRWQESLQEALKEFEETALYSADFAASRLNLGALAMSRGEVEEAEEHLRKAVFINRDFHSARSNLAILYSRQGKNDLAEKELRRALDLNGELPDIHYSLGLLLSEKKRYHEAADHLQKAAAAMENNGRVHYNLGQLLAFLRRDREAEAALQRSVTIEPGNMNYLQAMAQYYLDRREWDKARRVGEQMLEQQPDNPLGRQLLDIVNRQGQ